MSRSLKLICIDVSCRLLQIFILLHKSPNSITSIYDESVCIKKSIIKVYSWKYSGFLSKFLGPLEDII
jgi:hypothetical protein